jgi:hypothetical protein
MKHTMYTGFAVALAWPETLCKQPGTWYDGPMNLLGVSKNHYYKVGHAAVILIELKTGNCHYFDFGRYHAPFGHGRVRDAETDHDLVMQSKALISNLNEVQNLQDLLMELYNNSACHGQGPLYSSYTQINFEKACYQAKQMQIKGSWKYGPFVWNGTNCSRFVRTIVLSGNPPFPDKLKLLFPITITPTPACIVKSLRNHITIKRLKQSVIPDTCLTAPNAN